MDSGKRFPALHPAFAELPKPLAFIKVSEHGFAFARSKQVSRKGHVGAKTVKLRGTRRTASKKELASCGLSIPARQCDPTQDHVSIVDRIAEVPVTSKRRSELEELGRVALCLVVLS